MSQEAQTQQAAPGVAERSDEIWTFRGYKLRPSEFTTAMVHLYRGEISRANTWRQRLDMTTNWAVLTAGALLTFSFGSAASPHIVIPLGTVLVALFLVIEARRYRYYEVFTQRARLMETDFFASMLAEPFTPSRDWAQRLSDSLLMPKFPISIWEALGRRLRRNYLVIFLVLAASWILKLAIHPATVSSVSEFISRAAVGPIPGLWVIGAGVVFNGAMAVVAAFTLGLHEAPGEILPRYPTVPLATELGGLVDAVLHPELHLPWPRTSHLAYVITDEHERVSHMLLTHLKRGVTRLEGEGAYTRKRHSVLLCAIAPREVQQLKHIIHEVDRNAFVVIIPVQEILGRGFRPLHREDARSVK